MSVDLYSQAYLNPGAGDSTCRQWDDGGNQDNHEGIYVWRHKKGRAGRRRHWMVNTKTNASGALFRKQGESSADCIRFTPNSVEGHHPCLNLGESTLLRNSMEDFDDGADFGFKCTVNKSSLESLIVNNRTSQRLLGPAVIDTSNQRVNFLNQILFGAVTKSGQKAGGDGFCWDAANADKAVGVSGETCFELVQGAVNKETADDLGYEYCTNNRDDIRCACINVTGLDFYERCKLNPTWAGCSHILEKAAEVEKILCPFGENCPSSAAYGGNPDCLAPGICTGTQVGLDDSSKMFRPRQDLPSCNVNLNICNQLMIAEDLEAVGDLSLNQSCNIDVQGLMNDRIALEAAVEAAKEADKLWKENEYELQLRREQQIKEDAEEVERIRKEIADAQALDREAERTLAGQLVAHRASNVEKRRAERMAREDQFRAEDAQRAFEREKYESTKIAGMDPKTITFFGVALFCLILLIIFATKM